MQTLVVMGPPYYFSGQWQSSARCFKIQNSCRRWVQAWLCWFDAEQIQWYLVTESCRISAMQAKTWMMDSIWILRLKTCWLMQMVLRIMNRHQWCYPKDPWRGILSKFISTRRSLYVRDTFFMEQRAIRFLRYYSMNKVYSVCVPFVLAAVGGEMLDCKQLWSSCLAELSLW